MASRHVVCPVDELKPGGRKIIEAGGRSIGVFNVNGSFHALRNACPHQLAPLCHGTISGTTLPGDVGQYNYGREGQILRCPWHGWEFDITTGQSVFNPHKVRVKSYEVAIEPCCTRSDAPGTRSVDASAKDPSVETFNVEVEDQMVVVYA